MNVNVLASVRADSSELSEFISSIVSLLSKSLRTKRPSSDKLAPDAISE